MGLPNYEKNVKEEVRQGNTERVSYINLPAVKFEADGEDGDV